MTGRREPGRQLCCKDHGRFRASLPSLTNLPATMLLECPFRVNVPLAGYALAEV
jgi:hypothetical protein